MMKFLKNLANVLPKHATVEEAWGHAEWIDSYLIGHSDTDARWYYERCQWRKGE